MRTLNETIVKLLNKRIEQEELSARLYKAMSIWFNLNGFIGASKLWAKYANEEINHAQWAYDYLMSQNEYPEVPELTAPTMQFDGFPDVIKKSLEHEAKVLEQLQDSAKVCYLQGDYMTFELFQRYLHEQIEEMDKMYTFMDELEAFGTDGVALRLLDSRMAEL